MVASSEFSVKLCNYLYPGLHCQSQCYSEKISNTKPLKYNWLGPTTTLTKILYILFQNKDIGNFQGFEVLVKRLKDDRAVCKEYAEFLRQRSGI